MEVKHIYRVVLTVKHDDGSISRTRDVPVRASSEERAVDGLVLVIERETQKHVNEIIFRKVSF